MKKNTRGDPRFVFMGLGIELISVVLGSIWLGTHLDKTVKTQGVFVISLLIISLVGWFLRMLFLLKRLEKWEKEDQPTKHPKEEKNDFTH